MKEKIKILYIETWKEIGGGQLGLVDFLQEIDKDKFTPAVILPEANGPLYDRISSISGVEIRIFKFDYITQIFGERPFSPFIAPFQVYRLGKEILKSGADIVHANQIHAGKYACLASRKVGIPNIVTIRNVYGKKRFNVNRFVDRLLANNANYIVFNSQLGCDVYASRCKCSNALAIHNGISVKSFDNNISDESIKSKYGIPLNKKICTTVAKLTRAKGLDILIKAIPTIKKQFPNTHFVFVGDEYPGSNMELILKNIAIEAGVENDITWTGFSNEIPRLLNISRCTILPSVQGEGLPRAVIESMAAGIPPVASNLAAVSEVLTDGVCGFLSEPGNISELSDKVCKLLSLSDNEYNNMKKICQNRARSAFSRKLMMGQYMRLYEVLASIKNPNIRTWYKGDVNSEKI